MLTSVLTSDQMEGPCLNQTPVYIIEYSVFTIDNRLPKSKVQIVNIYIDITIAVLHAAVVAALFITTTTSVFVDS